MLIVKEDKSRAEGTGRIFVELTRNRELEIGNCDRLGYWCDKPHLRHFLRELKKCFTEDELREILGMKTTNKMREIKFRGKRLDNGAWETGSLVIKRMGMSDEEYYIADKMTGHLIPVDPATVGQFAELTGVDGVELYEGDIIELESSSASLREVIFTEGVFAINSQEGSYDLSRPLIDLMMQFPVIVHGNIHDSPELLKTE